ncbi:hypothetical protein UFOVP75_179 [uncultured Caudovirales phage]|uniref:Uncharacterized protein n=1 Tax=uncultured Caudovirales phage TaxID=2100421 RepID=A0A6J5L2H1_9CAUD|nr:hypothetical protein UFOVP75_179 [uncultured Caudovirales phage]
MSQTVLTASAARLAVSFDAALNDAFKNGVVGPNSTPPNFAALSGYNSFDTTVQTVIRAAYSLAVSSIASQVEEFQAPSLAGTWVADSSPFLTPGFRKNINRVELCGTVTGGSGTIFTLGATYRPTADIQFPVVANGAFGAVKITSAGVVSLVAGSTSHVSLDGISFGI